VAEEGRIVERYSALLQASEESPDIPPIEVEVVLLLKNPPPLLEGFVVQGKEGKPTVSADFRRDALPDLALRPWVDQKLHIRMAVGVDEPRRHDETGGIDHPSGMTPLQTRPEMDNPSSFHRHIHVLTGRTKAVVNMPSPDQEVVFFFVLPIAYHFSPSSSVV